VCWKDCGSQNLPFASFTQNLAWVATSLRRRGAALLGADDLPRRRAQKAEPKTIRYRLLHVAATLAQRGRRLSGGVLLKAP
jgi:hypothetical protein